MLSQEIAAEILLELEEELISAKEAMKHFKLDPEVRGSVHAYVMETLKRLNVIDFVIERCLENKSLRELNPLLRNLLRIGIYEMFYKNVHPALATDSAVKIAKRRMGKGAAALVNAVMRSAEKLDLGKEKKKLSYIDRIALETFHPSWYVELAIKLLGKEAFELMKANMENSVYVRVNEIKSSIESVRRYLEKFCEVEETILPYVFKVKGKHPSTLDWHEEGKYVVQDLASAVAAHSLLAKPGEFVVDLAAAPGIKTSQLAMAMENRGKIIAIDNSPQRLERMKAKMKQLGVKIVECRLGDGATFDPGKADRILLDPPCSTTGAVRNYPCVKWRFDRKKYLATISLQKKMLKNALKIGEIILYSTCSITFDENEGNLVPFEKNVRKLKPFKGFDSWKSCGIKECGGVKFKKYREVARLWPHVHDCCGFFIALLGGSDENRH